MSILLLGFIMHVVKSALKLTESNDLRSFSYNQTVIAVT